MIRDRDTACTHGVTPDPAGGIKVQARQVFERIDRLPQKVGTDKSRLPTARVWSSDVKLFQDHDSARNEWVDAENPPVRACVRSELWQPDMLVAIMVTLAKAESAWGRVESARRPSFVRRWGRGQCVSCWCIAQRTGQTQKPAPPKSRW